ncbi:fumarylacetoacetate hydrolase family protein [Actinomycetospora sp. NBC_00405]|uniref:fumarylacetoacetate hydrolase family protein n=1 Tax=Actinomycetospora sp. NBC_00405 TaxID=2975952 RepID=UPI002E1E5930
MWFALGTFTADGTTFPGLVVDDAVVDLRPHLGDGVTVEGLLQDWDATLAVLHDLAEEAGDLPSTALADLRLLAPFRPTQLLCAGANYFRHVRQIVASTLRNGGDERSEDDLQAEADRIAHARAASGTPFLFPGLPSAVTGPEDDVVLWGPGVQHDWELELGVVIGRPAHRIAPGEAVDVLAGYVIGNDISTRDVMARPDLPMTDFIMSKSRPTFFPTGPYLVPRECVPDPRQLRLRLSVNGQVMQDDTVDDIIYGIEELVSYASHAAVLRPGDLLLTGSPAGNAGHHGNRWLVPGDVIAAEITGLGRQRNRCVAPRAERAT